MIKDEMIKLGLSDKEAKVYLASLEIGPSSVQAISEKAKVNRATTYVVIDSLMDMGLMSTFNEDKKTLFTAEKPERLLDFLKSKEQSIKSKISVLEEKIPEIKSLINLDGKPTVKYFEGVEGLRSVQNDFMDSLSEGETIYTFLPYDDFERSNLRERFPESSEKRISKKITMRIIYTSRHGRQWEHEERERADFKEYKFIEYGKYPFHGGMNIYGDKLFMIDYLGKTGGIVIENKTLAKMMKAFFDLSWDLTK